MEAKKIAHVDYVKRIYQMLVLFYLFLKHIHEQSLMEGLFLVGVQPVYGRTL